ncbi:organic cation transporter protein [Anticarsia gemmatalis]|uniref:organic cation transporter protein n=1 Tax=Anticarsia gemmatalis TaxID=129554 RepID=UPI003F76447D
MESVYDRALSEVGNSGTFQKKFDFFYNVVFTTLWSVAYNNIILALTITPHMCQMPEKPENISEISWKAKYIPVVESETGREKFSDCLIYTNEATNVTKECNIFEFDKTWFETTVPSDNNWVCENEINIANIYAYAQIGEMIGSFFFGWFGDVYGRKLTYIISLALLIIGRFVSVVASSSFILFTIGCIIASFPSWSAIQSTAVISLEISSPKRRTTVAKLHLLATSFGKCLMPFFYWKLRNWKSFLIVTTSLQLLFLVISWRIIESPQWLWINGKSKKALKHIKNIAKVNKCTLSADTEREFLSTTSINNDKSETLGPLALFSGWRVAVHTTLQLFLWFCISANYSVAVFGSAEKSLGNPFLEFAWQSLAEIPGYFIAAFLADRIGRRFTGIISFSITTMIWIFSGFRETSNAEWLKNELFNTILSVTNRSSMTVSYYIINLLNMELYPTCLRQSGMSLSNVISGGASAFGSYVLYLGRRIDNRLPSVILSVTTVTFGILSIFYLPETLNAKLPETLEDAQRFGTKANTHEPTKRLEEEVELNNLHKNSTTP